MTMWYDNTEVNQSKLHDYGNIINFNTVRSYVGGRGERSIVYRGVDTFP